MTDYAQRKLPVDTYLQYPIALSLNQSRGRLGVGLRGEDEDGQYSITSPMLEHSLIELKLSYFEIYITGSESYYLYTGKAFSAPLC